MQPVMKAIESRYAGQVRVVFHDVMKDKAQAEKYGVQLIPTQVFLDSSGKELLRHQGFFAEASIDTFLRAHGLTPRS
jgi:thioredoxin 1